MVNGNFDDCTRDNLEELQEESGTFCQHTCMRLCLLLPCVTCLIMSQEDTKKQNKKNCMLWAGFSKQAINCQSSSCYLIICY